MQGNFKTPWVNHLSQVVSNFRAENKVLNLEVTLRINYERWSGFDEVNVFCASLAERSLTHSVIHIALAQHNSSQIEN